MSKEVYSFKNFKIRDRKVARKDSNKSQRLKINNKTKKIKKGKLSCFKIHYHFKRKGKVEISLKCLNINKNLLEK
jgi:hypothetical protein